MAWKFLQNQKREKKIIEMHAQNENLIEMDRIKRVLYTPRRMKELWNKKS